MSDRILSVAGWPGATLGSTMAWVAGGAV